MDIIFIYLTIFIISTIQSIVGVGILVLGTPILLLFNFSILEIMKTLLPLSVFSSLINLIIIKYLFNLKNLFELKLLKYFFILCLPGVLIGLLFLKNFNEIFNFKLIVAFVILVSIFLKLKFKNFFSLKFHLKKIFIFFIGFIHGLTNSGGTMLTLLLLNKNEKQSHFLRSQIHFFYLLLAFFQILFLKIIDPVSYINDNLNLIILAIIILTSSIIGNFISYKHEKIINILIFLLAFLASMALIFKNFI
jgi:uncharacterized protein